MPPVVLGDFATKYERKGSGVPVLFLHGGFASLASSFRTQETSAWDGTFSKYFDFVVHDRRGCYRASCPPDGYSPLQQAKDALALLDHLGVQRFHVLASSAGGPIAVALAAQHPDRVHSVVFVGSCIDLWRHVPNDPVEATITELIALLNDQGPEASLQARPPEAAARLEALYLKAEAVETGTSSEQAEREQDFIAMTAQASREQQLAYHVAELRNYEAYMAAEDRQLATAVAAPALVLHGERDQLVPLSWGQELAELLPAATLEVFEGRSHSLLQDCQAAREAAVSFFLDHSP